jgi:hypothetical protein
MNILKRLFSKNNLLPYIISEIDGGEATINITGKNLTYVLDLDWDDGVMDIEFNIMGEDIMSTNTTNVHEHYKLLNTISHITVNMAKNSGMKFHSVIFKSSVLRNGEEDRRSGEIRNRFFSSYVTRLYPYSKVIEKDGLITVLLNEK